MAIKIAIIAHACRGGGGLFQTANLLKALKNVTEDEQFMIVCPAGCGYEEIELPANSKLFVYGIGNIFNPVETNKFFIIVCDIS